MERHFVLHLTLDRSFSPVRLLLLEESEDALDLAEVGHVDCAPFETLSEALLWVVKALDRRHRSGGAQHRLPLR